MRPAPTSQAAAASRNFVHLREGIENFLRWGRGKVWQDATMRERLAALSVAVRRPALDAMRESERRYREQDSKRLYYLSMEFLMGRALGNNLTNLGMYDDTKAIMAEMGADLEELEDLEPDAALGNGGLGRLAACFLDSLATLDLPGFGYGINYEYGLFKQEIRNNQQVERPDTWRAFPSPWEIERPQDAVLVPLYGHIEHGVDRHGNYNPMWADWRAVLGVPHDILVARYGGKTVNYLRLYSARASHEFDIGIFNEGDYFKAVQDKVQSETISKVLYPSESAAAGRELRLVQE